MDNILVIIDGNSLMNRAFYALPELTNKDGLHTNAIYGFTTMLFKIIDTYKPTHLCVAFDKKAPTFRHLQYKEYKAGRKKMPDELRCQVDPLKKLLDAFGINRSELEGFEADDIIGTISYLAEEANFKTLIVTGDKDAIQLASNKTRILITKKGISDLEEYDYDEVINRYSLTPTQFIDLKGLMGDKSDNIPGVPGIGEKTGIKLLVEFSTIENLINNTDKLKGSVKTKIEENAQQAVMSKKLATIVRNMPVEIDFEELRFKEYDTEEIIKLFNEFEFTSLISRLAKTNKPNIDEKLECIEINTDKIDSLVEKIKNTNKMIIKILKNSGNIVEKNINKLFISLGESKSYYVQSEECIIALKEVLESKEIKKYGFNLKEEYIALRPYDICLNSLYFDVAIAEYIIDTTSSNYSIENIAAKYLGKQISSQEELLGKGKKAKRFEELESSEVLNYFSTILNVVKDVSDKMSKKIEEYEMHELFYNIEMPLVKILGFMEYEGFKVDKEQLQNLQIEYTLIIDNLEKEIHELAMESFNINSPKQLGVILFEKLNLPIIKKTKTGYSTDSEVLEQLKGAHPIIDKISEFRQIVKLKSTYVDGLLNIINNSTGKIHSSFNQTITTTGRISSTEPNLQNIPIRLEMGRNLRKVFVSEENQLLIDADYSQIELRVLAHISKDDNLINAFLEGEDIHTATASHVFSVPIEDVTGEMRSGAKAVNFGIVYGISDFGLSQNLGIPVKKAKEYIENYLNKYPNVKDYMDVVIKQGKDNGFVTTVLNRRRYIPEINSSNFVLRNFGKRLAMNTPIQGSAADIIKIAMVNVFERLENNNLKSKLILQVHDELIIQAFEDEVDKVSLILKEEMENAYNMVVPLSVHLSVGKTWYDTK